MMPFILNVRQDGVILSNKVLMDGQCCGTIKAMEFISKYSTEDYLVIAYNANYQTSYYIFGTSFWLDFYGSYSTTPNNYDLSIDFMAFIGRPDVGGPGFEFLTIFSYGSYQIMSLVDFSSDYNGAETGLQRWSMAYFKVYSMSYNDCFRTNYVAVVGGWSIC